jgi:hypothetical protein
MMQRKVPYFPFPPLSMWRPRGRETAGRRRENCVSRRAQAKGVAENGGFTAMAATSTQGSAAAIAATAEGKGKGER